MGLREVGRKTKGQRTESWGLFRKLPAQKEGTGSPLRGHGDRDQSWPSCETLDVALTFSRLLVAVVVLVKSANEFTIILVFLPASKVGAAWFWGC